MRSGADQPRNRAGSPVDRRRRVVRLRRAGGRGLRGRHRQHAADHGSGGDNSGNKFFTLPLFVLFLGAELRRSMTPAEPARPTSNLEYAIRRITGS
jgi:hypothetical protein